MSLADELLADFEDLAQDTAADQPSADYEAKNLESELVKAETKKSVFLVAKLLQNPESKAIMDEISKIDIKHLLADIDTEINIVYKFLKDIYNKRFPELESLVTSASEYIQTVHYLGNVTDAVKLDGIDFLPPAIKMVVTVTASTTLGEKLTDEEMVCVNETCQYFFDLMDLKVRFLLIFII
ncbi:U4/U6 small nuclear ribonucleoprotein Prp31 [Thelohanellus kitauei]|uniref:U4/U6 small nuclear ribonucleoprotein Prp31 n=1 Tax=Thelohanellus kitauei TaxID=669202 RepID=A0A0C2IKS9_THEKT|nr:U4/U6 small nuclear ribonucleoprotein Prp31 [Thelohanellus kitauei]